MASLWSQRNNGCVGVFFRLFIAAARYSYIYSLNGMDFDLSKLFLQPATNHQSLSVPVHKFKFKLWCSGRVMIKVINEILIRFV